MLRHDLQPGWDAEALPSFARQSFVLAVFSMTAGCLSAFQRMPWPRGRLLLAPVGVGCGLFVVPALSLAAVGNGVPAPTRLAAFTLIPVFAVILDPYLGRNSASTRSNGSLLAALAGVAGALCILPVAVPESLEAFAALAAVAAASLSVSAANCRATAVLVNIEDVPAFGAVAAGASAAALGAASAVFEHSWWQAHPLATGLTGRPGVGLSGEVGQSLLRHDLPWLALVDLPALGLLFWLMPRISAPRMATRYLWSLIFPVLLGAAFLRIPLMGRSWLGVLLMGAGAMYLLLARDRPAEPLGLSLR